MNKLFKILASTLLSLLFISVGVYFLAFSPIGSSILKPHIKKALEKKIGMPVDINTFDLEYGIASLEFCINKQAQVSIEVSEYDLLNDSYEGMYHIKTDKFTYEDKKLKKIDIKGRFKYMPEDVYLEGEGTVFKGKVDYRLNIIDNLPQQILLKIKDAQLSEVLQFIGHPDIAEGKIDVKVNIPDMGGDRENIYGYIELKKSYFKPARVKELYGFTLPEKSYLYGRMDGSMDGNNVKIVSDVQSNLFTLEIKNALVNMYSEQWISEYRLNAKDMRILTKNKLAGPLKLDGIIERDGKNLEITSKSNSLGGTLHLSTYIGGKNVRIRFEKLALDKLLALLKQPDYAKGELSGDFGQYWDIGLTSYKVYIDKGILKARVIEKISYYTIPKRNTFSLKSKGRIINKKLTANATIHSTLTDVIFSSLNYDFEKKILVSNYDILIHDLNAVIPKAQVKKDTSISAKGSLKITDKLSISGETKGLGKKVAFSYDSKRRAKEDAFELVIEKILVSAGVPVYTEGTLESQKVLTNIKPL
jgi:hypothetical protein